MRYHKIQKTIKVAGIIIKTKNEYPQLSKKLYFSQFSFSCINLSFIILLFKLLKPLDHKDRSKAKLHFYKDFLKLLEFLYLGVEACLLEL